MGTAFDTQLANFLGGHTTAAEAAVLENRVAPIETEEVTEEVTLGDETPASEGSPEGETVEDKEASGTEEVSGDEPITEEGEEATAVVDEVKSKIPKDDELKTLKVENTELLKHIEELAQLIGAEAPSVPETAELTQPTPVLPTVELPPTGKVEGMPRAAGIEQAQALEAGITLTQQQLDEISDNAPKFNAYMATVASTIEQNVREAVLREVEPLAEKVVNKRAYYKQMADDFYAKNPSLRRYPGLVQQTSTKVAAAHADWPIAQVFDEAAKDCYRLLPHLDKKIKQRDKSRPKGAFAGGTGGERPKPTVKLEGDQTTHMDDVLKGA